MLPKTVAGWESGPGRAVARPRDRWRPKPATLARVRRAATSRLKQPRRSRDRSAPRAATPSRGRTRPLRWRCWRGHG